ncbi:DUF3365 domain-containing protein [Leptolyngbya sp. FACHB-8]|uniref:Tll0287-like domain-containing protein n=1 Tax=unclassified Leptolyngbya TaxID=2650499 RepID=UPI001684A366|nr:DUF3365 domain-containing protein [Leptolyngbya sp. FACHB-8]MBD1913425.1 DUF3365 domain-containing protein [Leptolyngbya sp. FACHB-8]
MLSRAKLGTKFTVILLLVLLLGSALGGLVLSKILQHRAEEKITAEGLVLMESIKAVRTYTDEQVRPLLEAQLAQDEFVPEVVPAYAARRTFENFQARSSQFKDMRYKEAMLNPTNPRDRADAFEEDLIKRLLASSEPEISGFHTVPGQGQMFYSARPIVIESESCLRCHGRVADAPAQMIALYGTQRGFNWKLNRVAGTSVVYVPAETVFQESRRAFSSVMSIFVGAFAIALFGLNRLLKPAVIQPVQHLARISQRISANEIKSTDDLELADNHRLNTLTKRQDELGQLGRIFQTMVNEVLAREAHLRQQIQTLRIEIDQTRKQKEVDEIVESDYFKELKAKAKQIRKRKNPPSEGT